MTTITAPARILTAVIRPLSICSQLVRINGQIGWLMIDEKRWELNHRTSLSVRVIQPEDMAEAQFVDDFDYAMHVNSALRLARDLVAYYESGRYSGD